MTMQPADHAPSLYVTRSGLPLRITLEWPYHRSVSGADFYVMHATVALEDGGGLHALVAVQLTLTVKEILPTLDPKDTEGPTINTVRKAVDTKELEFQKSPKRVPVPFNSRTYDFKRERWAFGGSTDQQREELLARKVFWHTKLGGVRVWVADPVDAQYLDATREQLLDSANKLAGLGLMRVENEYAVAGEALLSHAEKFEADMQRAQEELEQKHAFERG